MIEKTKTLIGEGEIRWWVPERIGGRGSDYKRGKGWVCSLFTQSRKIGAFWSLDSLRCGFLLFLEGSLMLAVGLCGWDLSLWRVRIRAQWLFYLENHWANYAGFQVKLKKLFGVTPLINCFFLLFNWCN